jgi:PIN domain nuclease of toxin-antitoxin system
MNLLLDTHIWLRSRLEPKRISHRVAKALADSHNELWLSPISIWEIFLLHRKGRLDLRGGPSSWITAALAAVPLREALLTHEVALATEDVILPHSDPADRLLAATAKVYDLTLITADENLIRGKGYSVLANQT